MCLIAFAYKVHPDYPLILIANRDEFYKRPARRAQYWVDEGHPDILAGKDLTAGGTWLGIHANGKWAALTNHRDLSRIKDNPPSRGDLVLNYLKGDSDAKQYLAQIEKTANQYNGFNLLAGDKASVFHFSNEAEGITELEPGIHGLSNALLNTPWPKLEKAKSDLGRVVDNNAIHPDYLFAILADEKKANPAELPQTGLSPEMEQAVSSIFIKTDGYGTRCSTLLLIDKKGTFEFTERRYIPGTSTVEGEQHFKLT